MSNAEEASPPLHITETPAPSQRERVSLCTLTAAVCQIAMGLNVRLIEIVCTLTAAPGVLTQAFVRVWTSKLDGVIDFEQQ